MRPMPTFVNWIWCQVFICCYLVHPTTLSTSSSSISLSINSPSSSPRCSTPLFSKQRRTRPFLACELCRQRAFQSLNYNENQTKDNQVKKEHDKQQQSYHHHSATLHYHQYQTNNSSSIRRRRDRRRSSIDQLLVWIV
jgi:hypothetical protein